jgi:hypothetical protein
VRIRYVVHLRTSLLQLFALLQFNFEVVVQIIELRRFGGAPNSYLFAGLSGTTLRVLKPGESCLKSEKKTKHTSNLSTHTRHGPRRGGLHGPPEWPNKAPPRARSASLEGSRPLERVPPRSSAHALSSGFRLARGSLTSAPAPARGYEHLML